MPHTFPPRRIRAGEPVDPDVFNETFQAVAGKLAGRLNEQDIDATTLKANVSVVDDAYYAVHAIEKASDPNLEDAAPGGFQWLLYGQSPGGDAQALVDDNPSWDELDDYGTSNALSLTFDSSDDTLIIFAQAQHFAWWNTLPYNAPADGTTPATVRLQYALRVDNTVIDNSVTGAFFIPDSPPQQWYRAKPGENVTDYSDWRHILPLVNTVGINNAANATRLICSMQVESGTHTVSLVARRIPRNDYKIDLEGMGVAVGVYNRRLFVLRIKGSAPTASATAPSLSIDVVEDGQTVSLGSVFTDSLEAARTGINDVQVANVSRGALRNEHLPSLVYGADAAYIQPTIGVPQGCGAYPGYGVDDAAWVTVNDGIGTDLQITGPVGGWRFDQNPGTFIVLANVQVWLLEYTDGAVPAQITVTAVFTLAITNHLGVRTLLASTESVVNGHNLDEQTVEHSPIADDIPLLWVVDTDTLSADDKRISKVEVLVSYWDGTGNGDAITVETKRASIHAFALKNTHPS